MAGLAEQLEPLFRDWASRLVQDAGEERFRVTDDQCPVDEGILKASGHAEMVGDLGYHIEYEADHASYTDEGTEAHVITGNPLLAFFWDKLGRDVVFRSVNWVPGIGVEANKGWFSDAVSDDAWVDQLLVSIDSVPF